MDVFNEKSGVEFTAHFSDTLNTPTIPSTVHWRLDCETNGTVIRDWTEVTPTVVTDESGITDVTADIAVPGSLNAIQSSKNARELKTLLVVAAKDTDSEFSQTYQYYVKNLRGRS